MNDIIKRLDHGLFNIPSIFDEAFFTKPMKGQLFTSEGFPYDITVLKDKKDNPIETRLVFACAGVSKDNIEIKVEPRKGNNYLMVSMAATESQEDDQYIDYIHKGLSHRSMEKSFLLRDCDKNEITSELKDGLLTITIPMVQRHEKVTNIDIM